MEVELSPLETADFTAFGARIVPVYAAAKAGAGEWDESASLNLARADFQRRLPQGLSTPGHSLLAIRSLSSGCRVGALWLEYRSEAGWHVCVVLDVFIERAERRRGYGRAALLAAEAMARLAGAEEMRLTVFGDNEAARALYASLGYRCRNARLAKPLIERSDGMSSAVLEQTMTNEYRAGTFLPGDPSTNLEDLLETVWRNRLTTFLVVYAELFSLCSTDCEESGFLTAASEMIDAEAAERRALISSPVFQVWVGFAMRELGARLTGRTNDPQPLRERLEEFPHMLGRVREAVHHPCRTAFHRFDMDPLIAAALPPSYEVPDDPAERKARSQLGHPLAFFRDVAGIALNRIQAIWPEARNYFDRLVYAVCYLPGGDFRSCSASRYTGVILISNRDGSVLDLEESLVHEAGHQLLYNIVEAEPLTDDATDEQYRLPWSSQVRDFYGYFHAFYIYVLLAQYHERVMGCRAGRDGDFARERLRHILRGLLAALPDFQGNAHLTPRGHALAEALAIDVAELGARHRGLLASE